MDICEKKMITVFTPTYNRAYKLKDLFLSLMQQTCMNFEWLIIDDGSVDETKKLVESFDTNGFFDITYVYKENEGKHIAINCAAREAKGEWVFIVDSDDILTPNAIARIKYYCQMVAGCDDFAGVVGLRANTQGDIWHSKDLGKKEKANKYPMGIYEREYFDATSIEYRYKYKMLGDRAEVIRKDLLQKYQFPKIANEKFMPEGYLWLSTAKDGYKFRWFNEVIYITEYLEDGLTRNGRELARHNCLSRSYLDNFKMSIKDLPIKERFKSAINYYRYGKYGKRSLRVLYGESNSKWLSAIAIPISFVLRIK